MSSVKTINSISALSYSVVRAQNRPRKYRSKDEDKPYLGFIAKELNDIDTNFTWKNPEGIEWFNMLTYSLAEIKKLRNEVNELKSRL